jgi:hypothetical protein
VRVVAVTKGFNARHVIAAAHAGFSDVGENYAQELVAKRALVDVPLRWHYLGPLQTNKIHLLAEHADAIETISREREVEVLSRQEFRGECLIQVDFTGRAERHGAAEDQVSSLVTRARAASLNVTGLMTVAPIEPDAAKQAFARVNALCDELALTVRSMGMSDDLELALAAGSTEVRIGRALFGARARPESAPSELA